MGTRLGDSDAPSMPVHTVPDGEPPAETYLQRVPHVLPVAILSVP